MTITASESKTRTKTLASGEFTVAHLALVEALKSLALSSAGRKRVPVCNRVLATIGPETVELSGFDFDVAVTVTVPATDTTVGRMLIEHDSLTKVLTAAVKGARRNTLTAATVRLTATEGIPVVHVAGYGLPLANGIEISVDDFPAMPPASPPSHVVERAALIGAVERVAITADRGDLLPILTALRARFTREAITLLATDRYRLALDEIPATGTSSASINIPTQTLTKLLARLSGDQLRLGIDTTKDGQWLTILDESTSARLRLIDGDYPNVSAIVEAAALATVDVDRGALLQAATRAAAISKVTGGNRAPVTLSATTQTLTIAPACDQDKVKVSAPTMPATTQGLTQPWACGLNPDFLLAAVAAVAAVTGETVTVHLIEATKPIAFTGSDSSTYRHIVMPIRLG